MINLHLAINFIRHFFSAKRNGHGIHSPFAFELCEEVFYNGHHFYDFEKLSATRRFLWQNKTRLEVTDLGAGSKKFRSATRRIKDIAINGISTGQQSETLYKLIHYLKIKTCIELGTSIGLNTLYFAGAVKPGRVITIEGSLSLIEFARNLAAQHGAANIDFIHERFDKVLPGLLSNAEQPVMVYVDGNHTYEATLTYFKMILQKRTSDTVIVFDDIYWSQGMTKAWKELKADPAITLSIDAFYFGLVFFRTEVKEKVDLKIFI